ncbi:uncharacterized protein LOC124926491 [Impatiens glandulifera]|uniref:uncharacterized protein LOC124926491 n=1 Tax=Impatiens glandulifera TaxID=253017 RepID=UPI001FB0DFEC|nr:uncharacterized protein LOC124926491 [Impatiens glandulifera]
MGEALVGSSIVASFSSSKLSSLRSSSSSSSKGFLGALINPDRLQFRRGLVFQFNSNSKSKTSLLLSVRSQVSTATTYSSSITTDIPLYESPTASFDHYLEDKPRVFEAIFPDKRRSQKLNKDEWRIQMLPIQFLFLTVWPVIDMRLAYKLDGKDYPSGVPTEISRVVELNIVRWELKGLDNVFKPSEFSLNVKGALYPDRRGGRSRLKGQLQLSISFVLPPVLALVPEDVRRDVAETVLRSLVMNMKQKVNSSLLADYSEFKREKKLKALV